MTINTDKPFGLLLVDDSPSIRAILKRMLKGVDVVEVLGEAENGQIAIEKARELKPEIILLDIEMPVMDGITALPYILQAAPAAKIIMVSTLTDTNAAISIKALGLGAADYLQKPDAKTNIDIFLDDLLRKIKALGRSSRDSGQNVQPSKAKENYNIPVVATASSKPCAIRPIELSKFKPDAIAIASSTGGPQALQTLFAGLKDNMPQLPIFITQHMPPVFTKYLASSLATVNGIKCHEATENMLVEPGNIYLAPGDFHMLAVSDGAKVKIKLNQNQPENFCRPAADPMLRSLLEVYGGKLLVVVLTGMGQDGMLGAKASVEKGAMVIAQDKASSVVWGMPGAVAEAGIAGGIYPIDQIAKKIREICKV